MKRFTIAIIFFALLIQIILSCSRIVPDSVLSILQETQEKYAPESRTSIFDVQPEIEKGVLVLKGEVLSEQAKQELIDRLTELKKYKIDDRITLLPQPELGSENHGVICISVAQLRKTAGDEYEMTSQAIMGTEVRLLKLPPKEKDRWFRFCQVEDGYLGWIDKSSMEIGDSTFIAEWRSANKLIVTVHYSQVLENPNGTRPVSDLVLLNKVIQLNKVDDWYQVRLPDRRIGYVRATDVMEEVAFLNRPKATAAHILNTATSFMGIPYMWGGTSVKEFDCSGFTQTVFKFNGYQLPRDANMQVHNGSPISLGNDLADLQPADLLFWGSDSNRITHVGIYIGNLQFIHAIGMVRINSFNPADASYSEYRHRSLRAARRILN